MKNRKRLLLVLGMLALVTIFLSGCSTEPITSQSEGFWDKYIIWNFSQFIIWLSNLFGGNYGIGIILFTLIIRVVLLPLMHYQTKSTRKMSDLQPKIKALQEKYPSKDSESKRLLNEEQQALYAEAGVNPAAGCLPMLVQMPVLMALYQAISRTDVIRAGHFLWFDLGTRDNLFILPILAALFTFASSKLTMMGQQQQNGATGAMTYAMPAMILFMGISLPSALSLYWVVGNAFSVGQTLLLNNPFKIRKEREEAEQAVKDREKALKRAQAGGKKRTKKKK